MLEVLTLSPLSPFGNKKPAIYGGPRLYQFLLLNMVEAAGIEPASESPVIETSTGLAPGSFLPCRIPGARSFQGQLR